MRAPLTKTLHVARRALLFAVIALAPATATAGSSKGHGSSPPRPPPASHTPSRPTPSHTPPPKKPAPPKPQPVHQAPQFQHKQVKPGLYRIDIAGAPKEEGYILYEVDPKAGSTKIVYVAGIRGQTGMGEALKREVLRRHPPKVVHSLLVEVNHTRLLAVWRRTYPKRPSVAELRRDIPALRVEGYHYELVPDAQSGDIDLVMTPTPGSTTVTVRDEGALDQILKSEH